MFAMKMQSCRFHLSGFCSENSNGAGEARQSVDNYRGADHVADEFPRIFELRNSLPDPLPEGVAFSALDQTIVEYRQKRKFLRDVEAELHGLDAKVSAALRAKRAPLPRKHKKGVLQPLYDTLNERKD
jgi:hypothetical protein